MTMQSSPVTSFYPELCPNCEHYDAGNQKCLVSAVSAGNQAFSAMMIQDLTGECAYYTLATAEAESVAAAPEATEAGAEAEAEPPSSEAEAVEADATPAGEIPEAMPEASDEEIIAAAAAASAAAVAPVEAMMESGMPEAVEPDGGAVTEAVMPEMETVAPLEAVMETGMPEAVWPDGGAVTEAAAPGMETVPTGEAAAEAGEATAPEAHMAAEAGGEAADAGEQAQMGAAGGRLSALDEAAEVILEAEGGVPAELSADLPVESIFRKIEVPAEKTTSEHVMQTAPAAAVAPEAPRTIEEPPTPHAGAPAGGAKPLGEARIHCPKCKVENAANATRCQNCGELLLPAEGTGVRFLYFVFGVLFAAGFAFLFYQFYVMNPGTAPDIDFLNPVVLIVGAFASLIAGIVLAVRRTPEYEKYENRAKRHLGLNLWQSLADVNRAMKAAPEKKQGGLIKLRAQVFEKLGMADDAMRDRLVLITSPNAYKSEGETVSMFTGADADVYARSRKKTQIKAVLNSGNVVAVGYCPKCKAVVELDADEHCKTHVKTKGQEVEYVISADVLKGRLAVLAKLERRHAEAAGQLTGLLAAGQAVAQGYCPRCKGVVTLDVERRCMVHPKVKGKWTAYSVPTEAEKGKKAVQEAMRLRGNQSAKNIILILTVLVLVIAVYYLLTM